MRDWLSDISAEKPLYGIVIVSKLDYTFKNCDVDSATGNETEKQRVFGRCAGCGTASQKRAIMRRLTLAFIPAPILLRGLFGGLKAHGILWCLRLGKELLHQSVDFLNCLAVIS